MSDHVKREVKKDLKYKWTRHGLYKGMVQVTEEPDPESEMVSVLQLFEPREIIRVSIHELS